MGWVGPNGHISQNKRWVVFATLSVVAGWIKGRMKRQGGNGAG